MAFDLFFNPPGDVVARREYMLERDLAAYGLMGAVTAIVSGAKISSITAEFRAGQLARALADAEARQAAAQVKYDAAMTAWRLKLAAEARSDPENDVRGL